MSSPQRRRELRIERIVRDAEEEAERSRVENLSWYERIEEARDIHDIKAILHKMIEEFAL